MTQNTKAEQVKVQPKIILWSGGKDSTATIILAHELGLKIDLIATCFVWFDKEREIYGENPEKTKWMIDNAIPIFEKWGYPVKIVTSDNDYLHHFYHVVTRSKRLENNGRSTGFLVAGACKMQTEKTIPLKRLLRSVYGNDYIEIVGICADEPMRIEAMTKRRNQTSLLNQYGITQKRAMEMCLQYGLLSPTYRAGKNRDGCWFCPNQRIAELAELRKNHPELWEELKTLSRVKDTIVRCFRFNQTFDEVEAAMDALVAQLSIYDIGG